MSDAKSCGVNKCPYLDLHFTAQVKSSASTWQALIFVLLCNAVSVVLTALLPSLLSGNVYLSTSSSTALSELRWRATSLDDDGEYPDGYRMVGAESRATDSLRRKTMNTLYLFGDRRLLLLAPTIIVAGLTGSFTVAAFHQVGRRIRQTRSSAVAEKPRNAA